MEESRCGRVDRAGEEHEPFGEPYYYGPERLGDRFENDPEYREKTGFSQATYKDIFDKIEQDGSHVRIPPKPPSPWLS